MPLGTKEKKILELVGNLGEVLQRNDYVTARETAKELHLLLKGEEIVQLPIDTITEIKKLLNLFYNRHQELWDLNKKFYGIGRQLEDLSERVK